ncbi:MAG: sigma-70 family RNA polymerase sigma factor, partial [Ignavibacterium sp.]|nr:sigma-70 family RNA polymerase sigma factor [Ignavibacterium sp.]MDW8375683.1 sigma-70 family RNA polymerase sigma factor [Ignavibacteriales bacterium]
MSEKNLYDLSDEELILEFQQKNNQRAFEILVKRFKNPLINFVYRFLGDYDSSVDVVQDTFVKVYRYKDRYSNVAKFSTWIYTIATNLAKTEYQRRKRAKFISIFNVGENENYIEIKDNNLRPDKNVYNKYKEEQIQKALLKVKVIYREPVILRDIQGLTYEEISEILNIEVGTVKSRINRGRKRLQKLLK